jgi:hypothetical protein
VAARSKAWIVFARSNAGIVGSNPTQVTDVCVSLFCVCVTLCGGSGLATGWSPVQGVLPTLYRIKKLKKSGQGLTKGYRAIIIIINRNRPEDTGRDYKAVKGKPRVQSSPLFMDLLSVAWRISVRLVTYTEPTERGLINWPPPQPVELLTLPPPTYLPCIPSRRLDIPFALLVVVIITW